MIKPDPPVPESFRRWPVYLPAAYSPASVLTAALSRRAGPDRESKAGRAARTISRTVRGAAAAERTSRLRDAGSRSRDLVQAGIGPGTGTATGAPRSAATGTGAGEPERGSGHETHAGAGRAAARHG